MKVLSLFDGISCARVALERAGIPVEVYYASEIDKYAMQISKKNYPDIIELGNVTNIKIIEYSKSKEKNGVVMNLSPYESHDFGRIDLLIGGSPCQDLSIAKKDRKGLDGERSGLFWEYVRILNEVKPKYFILENVASMPKEAKQIISETLGVEAVMINASLVSAQNRKRYFWVGKLVGDKYEQVEILQPEDRGILLRDILEPKVDESFIVKPKSNTVRSSGRGSGINDRHNWDTIRIGQIGNGGQGDRIYSPDGKSVALSALGGGRGAKTGLYCISSTQKHATITENKSTPLTAAMGMGGGHVPMITDGFIIPEATKKGYAIAKEGDSVDLSFPNSSTRRGRVGKKVKNLMTSQNIGVVQNMQIRKLTPIECERLQGLPDNYTEGVSNTQRYKSLGNAFNVDVVAHILSFLK